MVNKKNQKERNRSIDIFLLPRSGRLSEHQLREREKLVDLTRTRLAAPKVFKTKSKSNDIMILVRGGGGNQMTAIRVQLKQNGKEIERENDERK